MAMEINIGDLAAIVIEIEIEIGDLVAMVMKID